MRYGDRSRQVENARRGAVDCGGAAGAPACTGRAGSSLPRGPRGLRGWFAGASFSVGRFVTRHYGLCAALVLALMACNVFLGLSTSGINDLEEGRYGVSAFEMQQHRSFVVTTYGGNKEFWACKPPLGYLLMALSFGLFGGSALAMRLPSALCALATVALTMRWARRWSNRRLAILAGLIVATTFGFLSHHGARSGDFDACLTLILLLAAVQLPGLGESPWRVVGLSAVFACGFLLKSFAIVPMVLVTGSYLLWSGAWRRQRLVPCVAALGLFGAIVGTWAFARWQADGSTAFFVRMINEDLIGRSTSIVDRSSSSPFSYATALFDRFAPWPLVMIGAAVVAIQAGRRPLPLRDGRITKLLWLWVGVPFAIVSFVRTQHHWYLDPIYPALAMVAAGSALLLVERSPGRLRTPALVALVALPLALCEGRVLARVLITEPMPADQRFLSALNPSSTRGCREIRTTSRLLYSERFILEVIDGFEVIEPAPPPAEPDRFPAATCLLVEKNAWRHPPPPPTDRLPGSALLVTGNPTFALYRARAVGPPSVGAVGRSVRRGETRVSSLVPGFRSMFAARRESFALSEQRLELGDGFEVFGPARGPLDLDESQQVEAKKLDAERRDVMAVGQEILVGPAAGDLAEEIKGAQRSRKGEVEAPPQGFGIPEERKPRRRAALIGSIRLERACEALQVGRGTPIDQVEILGQPRRAVDRGGDATHHDELDVCLVENSQQPLELSHREARSPARASSSAACWKSISLRSRSSTVSRRFSRRRVRSTFFLNASITGSGVKGASRSALFLDCTLSRSPTVATYHAGRVVTCARPSSAPR